MERVVTDPRDVESLQRGARLFVNYCLNCHSAKYMRYNNLANLGLTEQQIADNLILTGRFEPGRHGALQFVPAKIGETMQVTMPPAQAEGVVRYAAARSVGGKPRTRHAVAVQLPARLLPGPPVGDRLEQPRVPERRDAACVVGAVRAATAS